MKIQRIDSLLEQGKRKNIEDYIYPLKNAAKVTDKVFIVCDGVGGESKGEVASKIVAETIGTELSTATGQIIKEKLQTAIEKAVLNINSYISQHPGAEKMSTTLTVAVVLDDKVLLAWCGDSKIYYVKKNKIFWKSRDHSLVQQLIDTGTITEAEAKTHPQRNIILRSVSANTKPGHIDYKVITDIADGDYLLLATDGIFEQVTDDVLTQVLNSNAENKATLFYQLCEGNTGDNYSMYLLRIANSTIQKNKKQLLFSVALIILIILGAWLLYKPGEAKNQPVQVAVDDTAKGVVPSPRAIPPPGAASKSATSVTAKDTSVKPGELKKQPVTIKKTPPMIILKQPSQNDTARQHQKVRSTKSMEDSLIKVTDTIKQ